MWITNFRATQITLINGDPGLQGAQGDEGIRDTKLSQVFVASMGTQLRLGTQAILVEEVGTRVQPTKAVGQRRTYKGLMSATGLHLVEEQCRLYQCHSQLPKLIVQSHPIRPREGHCLAST